MSSLRHTGGIRPRFDDWFSTAFEMGIFIEDTHQLTDSVFIGQLMGVDA